MAYIKNIEHGKVIPLADEIHVQKGQIVSKTLAQNGALSLTLHACESPHAVYAVEDFKWLLTVVFPLNGVQK